MLVLCVKGWHLMTPIRSSLEKSDFSFSSHYTCNTTTMCETFESPSIYIRMSTFTMKVLFRHPYFGYKCLYGIISKLTSWCSGSYSRFCPPSVIWTLNIVDAVRGMRSIWSFILSCLNMLWILVKVSIYWK